MLFSMKYWSMFVVARFIDYITVPNVKAIPIRCKQAPTSHTQNNCESHCQNMFL